MPFFMLKMNSVEDVPNYIPEATPCFTFETASPKIALKPAVPTSQFFDDLKRLAALIDLWIPKHIY
jgi:hypothetical protein